MTTIEYKIYVGLFSDKTKTLYPQSDVTTILDKYFDVYTVQRATGSWKGTQEPSLIITLIDTEDYHVRNVSRDIKRALHQEAVLITENMIQSQSQLI